MNADLQAALQEADEEASRLRHLYRGAVQELVDIADDQADLVMETAETLESVLNPDWIPTGALTRLQAISKQARDAVRRKEHVEANEKFVLEMIEMSRHYEKQFFYGLEAVHAITGTAVMDYNAMLKFAYPETRNATDPVTVFDGLGRVAPAPRPFPRPARPNRAGTSGMQAHSPPSSRPASPRTEETPKPPTTSPAASVASLQGSGSPGRPVGGGLSFPQSGFDTPGSGRALTAAGSLPSLPPPSGSARQSAA